MSQTAYRTYHATEVTEQLIGEEVTLAGWVDRRRDHGGVAFIDLRDSTGLVQIVINDEEIARPLRSEFVIQVIGKVRLRPDGNENVHLKTGKIEVVVKELKVLAKSDALPFQVSTALENESENKLPGEDVRLAYRYLDLRRPEMQRNLKLRSDMTRAARHALEDMDFTEVETPTFIKSTPEGARDFVVPARLVPGSWYALPQSPQLLKQLLMVGGIERYYQLARCYRDEDFRADRQPEFTQLDIEMSYVSQEDVIAMAEHVIQAIWKTRGYEITLPLPRITWQDAMDHYGSDKPDLRFGNQLIDLTEYFKGTPFRVFQAAYVGAVLFKGGSSTPRRQFDAWQEWARQRGAKGLAYVQFGDDGELKGPVAKNLSDEERNGLKEAVGAENGDAVFFAAGSRESSQLLLGAVRVELARRAGLLHPDDFAFTWVVDFPLFKRTDDPDDDDVAVGHSKWTSMHHPFTMPSADWIDTFDKDPEHAMSDSYDIVCNGEEMGGGSVRIHRDDIQDRVLKVLGIEPEEAQEKFGFLLQAFKFGAPPHAGIALGWDRTVSILAGASSIRDVIAFPKAGGGRDPLTGAPAPISDEQRADTGVDYDPDEDDD
ncbi:aspartate--tRNA ligase [Bifidobacterium mongoliense]|jgi:aspartyl-tRNA synthetase|uniref:Aspartate--tRNA(Asp/Asn) ligase n=1 Tax=Bifidobacterium mongoliense DSM 21395 TaxID=1437603 RepID=A0A087CA99_9BIFI|nr:aspartate--tRNA ligase [Bifidobacterium mongoliense]KFI80199.1 aspartyl-tRNA ligase [Bifidobacterium mongoliense DSM 21395]MDN5632945.1 aspartate--tRNA ligase [Bifidobacterium mongoliense]MDN6782696.1 aspartate--tRNA ligase [Bifidobacterium mongoliense]MDN6802650.1 aspartate--tRNA ligase [Bifidobacterium mongoliense]